MRHRWTTHQFFASAKYFLIREEVKYIDFRRASPAGTPAQQRKVRELFTEVEKLAIKKGVAHVGEGNWTVCYLSWFDNI